MRTLAPDDAISRLLEEAGFARAEDLNCGSVDISRDASLESVGISSLNALMYLSRLCERRELSLSALRDANVMLIEIRTLGDLLQVSERLISLGRRSK